MSEPIEVRADLEDGSGAAEAGAPEAEWYWDEDSRTLVRVR